MADAQKIEKSWYTVVEVAELLQVYEGTVRRWIREGEIPALRLGERTGYRISAEDVDDFIERRMTGKAVA